jgi:hypothetical protein
MAIARGTSARLTPIRPRVTPVDRARAAIDPRARRAVRLVRRAASLRALRVRRAFRRLDGPLSDWYGFDRGTPIDRPYIEAFLAAHAADVRGRVLEVKSDDYARRFGGARVRAVDVVDVDADNAHATLVADLNVAGALEPSAYDCVLLTQTLQFLTPSIALPQLYAALVPGGVLLVTTSALTRQETPDTDRWRLPPAGLLDLLLTWLPPEAEVQVEGRGNAVAAAASLLGMVVQELSPAQLAPVDWRFPVVSLARVHRPSS